MTTSILDDVKQALGLDAEYDVFDKDLILHINSVLADLHQLGVGPEPGFAIEDEAPTWTDVLADDPRMNNVKSYMYLRVRMLFDPPTAGYVITAMEKLIEKAEWRINMAREDIKYPLPPEPVTIPDDPFGDIEIVIDGGGP